MFRTVCIIICFFALLPAGAQDPEHRGHRGPRNKEMDEKIQIERIAFFSEKIGLTTDEAQLFWPIYNEMDQKRTALFDEKAAIIRRYADHQDNMKGKEVDDLLKQYVNVQKQESELPVIYNDKFRKVLSAEKVMKLYVTEMQFRSYLLQKMRNRKKEEPNNK